MTNQGLSTCVHFSRTKEEHLNKQQAAKLLGLSERAINRYVSRGMLSVTYKRRAEGSKEAIYDPAEVKKLKKTLSAPPPTPIVKQDPRPVRSTAMVKAPEASLTHVDNTALVHLVQFAEAIAGRLPQNPINIVPIADKLTLTLRDAAALAGLSRDSLRDAIRDGKLKAEIRGRGWNIKRSDLNLWIKKL